MYDNWTGEYACECKLLILDVENLSANKKETDRSGTSQGVMQSNQKMKHELNIYIHHFIQPQAVPMMVIVWFLPMVCTGLSPLSLGLLAPCGPLTSMDVDPNMYPILIPPASNTFHFCDHPQPHHSQPYHAQSIIYHPLFVINGNSRYWAYSITISIFLIFNRLPCLLRPPLNSVKWSSPQNDSCHRRYSPIQNLSSTMHIFINKAKRPSGW